MQMFDDGTFRRGTTVTIITRERDAEWKRILRKKESGEKLTAEEASYHNQRLSEEKERAKKREEGMRLTDALLHPPSSK